MEVLPFVDDEFVEAPRGNLLLIEQKSGFLSETPEGLAKHYQKKEKLVPVQMARSAEALRKRLHAHCQGDRPALDSLLYCPDYTVRQPGSAGIDPARIVDAAKREHLIHTIRSLLPEDDPARPLADEVHRFLRNELRVVADVATIAGQARTLYTQLSGGLAEWARCIECEPFRLRVVGTAGSGKTQLALDVLQDAIRANRRPLYVCYNRPLADHVALIAPAGATVATYHQLCDRILRSTGQAPDFSTPGAFAALEAFIAEYQPDVAGRVDDHEVDLADQRSPLVHARPVDTVVDRVRVGKLRCEQRQRFRLALLGAGCRQRLPAVRDQVGHGTRCVGDRRIVPSSACGRGRFLHHAAASGDGAWRR